MLMFDLGGLDDADAILVAMRQILRWEFAALQDAHPFVKLLHANYAVGDLDLLRQMVGDVAIQQATGHEAPALARRLTDLQDDAQRAAQAWCGRPVEAMI